MIPQPKPSYFATPGLRAIVFIKDPEVKMHQITETVCTFMQVDKYSLFRKTRHRTTVEARQICMYFAKMITDQTLKAIGEFYGHKDHTTVIHSLRTVRNLSDTIPEYRYRLEAIANLF